MVNLYKLLSTKGTLFAFLLGLICIVIFYIPVLSGLDAFNALPEEEREKSNIFNTGISIMLILMVIAVVVAILWAVIQMLMNPAGAKMGLLWLVVIGGLFAVGYFVLNQPDNAAVLSDMKALGVTEGQSKFIGGGLWLMLLMLFASVAIFVLSEVRNLFK